MPERFITDTLNQADSPFDISLRPGRFDDFVGQDKVRERLELSVQAAREREDVLDHVLLSGPPGLGKTTLAYILAEAMGVNVKATSGPVIDKAGDLAGLLTNLERGDILFIDEIHRMQKAVEEYLYSAMEDFVIDIVIDQGPNARSVRLESAAVHPGRRHHPQRLAVRALPFAVRDDQRGWTTTTQRTCARSSSGRPAS